MKRIGFGQVEPNHLSAKRTGQIYAQLPADSSIKVLENGMFVKYDYAAGKVNLDGAGEWMLVLNEVKLYDDAWRVSYKDFAMLPDNREEMYPRVMKTNVGDIFTTNCLIKAGAKDVETDMGSTIAEGEVLTPDTTGYLKVGTGDMEWKVVKIYTMPDGQEGVKIQRIK